MRRDGERWTDQRAPLAAKERSSAPTIAAVIGIGVTIIGSIGPWASLGFVSLSGLEGDGVITIIASLVAAAFLGIAEVRKTQGGRAAAYLAAGCGLVATGVAIYDLVNLGSAAGWGVWLTAAGGATLLVASGLVADQIEP